MSILAPLLFLRVTARRQEAPDIYSYELAAATGAELPAFTAGAHVDIHLPGGAIRQYSLCNSPAERHRYVIGVLRDPNSRGGSVALHDRVKVGDPVYVSSPRNHFPLLPGAKRSILLAGGIGVTPILSMAEQLHADGCDFRMHYCTRAPERTAFLDRLAAAPYLSRVTHHLDSGSPEQKLNLPAVLTDAGPESHLYVCGPAPFIDFVARTASEQGWAASSVHSESFSAAPVASPGDTPFEVEIVSTGAVYTIPADRSTLAFLLSQGVDIPSSCEQGICGVCLTRVLRGEPDHRDQYLTPEEHAQNDQFTPCCSRAKSKRLVLDL
jgi:vanillate O-demethylase ferredoxin subunit